MMVVVSKRRKFSFISIVRHLYCRSIFILYRSKRILCRKCIAQSKKYTTPTWENWGGKARTNGEWNVVGSRILLKVERPSNIIFQERKAWIHQLGERKSSPKCLGESFSGFTLCSLVSLNVFYHVVVHWYRHWDKNLLTLIQIYYEILSPFLYLSWFSSPFPTTEILS